MQKMSHDDGKKIQLRELQHAHAAVAQFIIEQRQRNAAIIIIITAATIMATVGNGKGMGA